MKSALIGLCFVSLAQAGLASEIRMLIPAPARPFVQAAVNEFTKEKPEVQVTIDNAPGPELVRKINAGEKYEVVITTRLLAGSFNDSSFSNTAVQLAESQAVIVYRKGAMIPQADTEAGIKQMVAQSSKLSYSDPALGGASSVFFVMLAKELGIEEMVRSKAVVTPGGRGGEPVARGEAEVGVAQLGETLSLHNVLSTPLLPSDPRSRTQFVAGVGPAGAQNPEAAEFVAFLTSNALAPLKRETGLQ